MAYNNPIIHPLIKQIQVQTLAIPSDILDELISRFVMNIPEEERQDSTRVCFQIELAHWFFVDNYCGEDKNEFWKQLGLIQFIPFAKLIFQRTPYLQREVHNVEKIVQDFKEYKMKVPTFGAILMDKDLSQVVLVQGFGGQWGFPKGKINKDEDPADCASREVQEETGYDCSPLLKRNFFIESCNNERWTRLYIIRGVDRNFVMKPHTRYEIKNIGWFKIHELPECKKDPSVITRPGFPHTAFHNIFPYVKRLRRWIDDKILGKGEIEYFKSHAPNRPDHILDRNWKPHGRNRKPSSSSSSNNSANALVGAENPLAIFMQNHPNPPKKLAAPHPPQQQVPTVQQQIKLEIKQEVPEIKPSSVPTKSEQQTFTKQINPKRRLFASDDEPLEDLTAILQSKMTKLKLENTPPKSTIKTTAGGAAAGEIASKENSVKQEFSKNIQDFLISSNAWTNFKLNPEEIIRAMALSTAGNSNKVPNLPLNSSQNVVAGDGGKKLANKAVGVKPGKQLPPLVLPNNSGNPKQLLQQQNRPENFQNPQNPKPPNKINKQRNSKRK